MELRREPYLLKFKKDNEAAVAKKIKELQMAAEQQKKQVKSPLIEQPPQVPQRDIQVSTSARTNKGPPIQATKTARKRPKCQDYLDRQPMPNGADPNHYAEEQQRLPLPLIVIPNKEQPKQTKEEDKQLEYLKSDEYQKYLDRLTQAHSKEDKAKVIKENRNNNVYLGKTGMDRKQYIQEIIRTKQVLPRVNLQSFRAGAETEYQKPTQQPQRRHQHQTQNWRGQMVDSLVFNENPRPKSVKKPLYNRRQVLQQSPIRYAEHQFSVPSNRQKASNNVTIILSPVCQNHEKHQTQKQQNQQQQQRQDNYVSKRQDKYQREQRWERQQKQRKQRQKSQQRQRQHRQQKQQRDRQKKQQTQYKEKKSHRQQYKDKCQEKRIVVSYHNQKPKTPKKAEIPKQNIVFHQQKQKPLQTKAIKCETYRKQFQYCEKMNYHATQRDNKRQKSHSQKKYSCKFRIDDDEDKENYDRKRKSPQPQFCSSPSFHQKKPSVNCIYDISFKIDKPSANNKEHYYQPQRKENPNIYSLNRHSPSPNFHKTPQKPPSFTKHSQPRQRFFTEISSNCYPLQSSQTNSAMTRQDAHSNSRSPHKITVISRSKHRK